MSVRKRVWFSAEVEAEAKRAARVAGTPKKWREFVPANAEEHTAWVVDYLHNGKRHLETFQRKGDADTKAASIKTEQTKGTHTPKNASIKVAQAAEDWILTVKAEGRERSTLAQYRQHVDLHIVPRIGSVKLGNLTTKNVLEFRNDLLKALSKPMARKVLVSFKSILRNAQLNQTVAQNVASPVTIKADKRDRRKLEVGVDIPTPEEVRRIIDAAEGFWRALLMTVSFTGMRASELRGLRWSDVEFSGEKGVIRVRQRADRYNQIGHPKSEDSKREIPIGPMVVSTLRRWRLECPKGELGLVFPTAAGAIWYHSNLAYGVQDVQVKAGVTQDGKAKYGPHSFRHFFASWCINATDRGGRQLPPKAVQTLMGHASITLTMDRYGHLFPNNDNGDELAAAERLMMGVVG